MCILAVFAPVSAKCTYENSFFLKIIRAQSLPEAFFDENARIKTAFSRFSYVHIKQTIFETKSGLIHDTDRVVQ